MILKLQKLTEGRASSRIVSAYGLRPMNLYDDWFILEYRVITCQITQNNRKFNPTDSDFISTSKEPVCPRVELILKIIIILLIIFLGFIKSKPC